MLLKMKLNLNNYKPLKLKTMYPGLTKENLIAIIGGTYLSTKLLAENMKLYILTTN